MRSLGEGSTALNAGAVGKVTDSQSSGSLSQVNDPPWTSVTAGSEVQAP